jgi:hypothetical protein
MFLSAMAQAALKLPGVPIGQKLACKDVYFMRLFRSKGVQQLGQKLRQAWIFTRWQKI